MSHPRLRPVLIGVPGPEDTPSRPRAPSGLSFEIAVVLRTLGHDPLLATTVPRDADAGIYWIDADAARSESARRWLSESRVELAVPFVHGVIDTQEERAAFDPRAFLGPIDTLFLRREALEPLGPAPRESRADLVSRAEATRAALGLDVLVVLRRERGALVVASSGERLVCEPPPREPPPQGLVIDEPATTATFIAVWISGILGDWPLSLRLARALECASRVAPRPGCRCDGHPVETAVPKTAPDRGPQAGSSAPQSR
jgi:hypothetical protein